MHAKRGIARDYSRRQPPRRRARPRRRWLRRTVLAAGLLILALVAWAAIARQLAPVSNTARTRFDAIVVLGSGADKDGNPTPEQLSRVTEAVHEYERGMAPRIIVTGAAVANRFNEAEVMARSARALGVPSEAILLEPNARDTIQNVCYSVRILERHGWNSAEVVSTSSHLPRAAMILGRSSLQWQVHAAPSLEPESAAYRAAREGVETLKTLRYLTWARWSERCTP